MSISDKIRAVDIHVAVLKSRGEGVNDSARVWGKRQKPNLKAKFVKIYRII